MLYDEQKFMIALFCKNKARIYEYELSTSNAEVSPGEYNSFLINFFKKQENPCLTSGNTLYLQRPISKLTVFKTPKSFSQVEVTAVFRCEMPLKSAKKFFHALFNKIVDHLNDFGHREQMANSNDSKIYQLQTFQGLWSADVISIGSHDTGVLLKFDIRHKLVGQRSVYEYIQNELAENCHRKDCLDVVKDSLLGKTVMTRYNDNKTYVIHDVDFATSPKDQFEDGENKFSFAEFFKRKYKVETRFMKQPLLINRVSFEEPNTGNVKHLVHCLIPEFCYPICTEWNLVKDPKVAFAEFVGCLRYTPNAREILGEWKISFQKLPVQELVKRVELVDLKNSTDSDESFYTAVSRHRSAMK